MFPLDEHVTFKDRVLVTEWIYGLPLKDTDFEIRRLATLAYLHWLQQTLKRGVILDVNIDNDIIVSSQADTLILHHIDPVQIRKAENVDMLLKILASTICRMFNLQIPSDQATPDLLQLEQLLLDLSSR